MNFKTTIVLIVFFVRRGRRAQPMAGYAGAGPGAGPSPGQSPNAPQWPPPPPQDRQ